MYIHIIVQSGDHNITFLGNERVKYGNYLTWQYLGTSILTFISALLAWAIRIDICDHHPYGHRYGYFASFLIGVFFLLLSLISFPMFEYKYESDRVINWNEVKSTVFRGRYILDHIFCWCCCFFWNLLRIFLLRRTRGRSFNFGYGLRNSKIVGGNLLFRLTACDEEIWRFIYFMCCVRVIYNGVRCPVIYSGILVCPCYRYSSQCSLWIGVQCTHGSFL